MPLVGGGGSPNTVGGNPSGTGTGLNYTGNHAYAYSGLISCGTSYTTLLDFHTGNQYIVIKFNPVYFTEDTGENCFWQITIDGQLSYHTELTSSANATPFLEVEILLPAFSRIQVKAKGLSATRDLGAVLTGRVYA